MDDVEVFGVDGSDTVDGCCVPTFGQFSETPSCTPTNNEDTCCSTSSDECCTS